MKTISCVAALLLLVASGWQSHALAQDDQAEWKLEAEISGVWVGGNSTSRTVGASALATREWPKSTFRIRGGGLRTESTIKTQFAVGSEGEFDLREISVQATTAEAFYARTSYEYRFSDKSFVIGGLDWLRNTFSGIDSRFLLGIGAGQAWVKTDQTLFETTFGFTYTFESEVVQNPFNTGRFPGVRLAYNLDADLSETTTFDSNFAGDWNLDNPDDFRFDWTNSISVSIVSVLALKPSLKLLWRNEPALKEIPLQPEEGQPPSGSVFVPLEKLDTFLTLALVLTL